MPDLYLAIQNLMASGQLNDLVCLAVRTATAEQAKAPPSRGQIAAMVAASLEANPALNMTAVQIAARAVEVSDALIAELAKPTEASR